jgi:hypothetical protein
MGFAALNPSYELRIRKRPLGLSGLFACFKLQLTQ